MHLRAKSNTLLRISLAALLLIGGAHSAASQPLGKTDVVTAAGSGAQKRSQSPAGAIVESYQGMAVGFTADGAAFRGNPDATLTLIEYTDYVCPYCASYFQQTLPGLLEKYVSTGRVKLVVRDLPLDSLHPTAPRAASAVACVAEQGATRFWKMHDALFQGQPQWGRLPDPTAYLADAAKKAGVDEKVYNQCVASGRADARVKQSASAAQALGFVGTPTFQFVRADGKAYPLVGAQPIDVFASLIDTLLAGNEPPQAKEQEKPELPFWAKAEGLAPDPKRPGFTVAGDPYKGNPSATLTLVEFGDFECPACQRHTVSTQPDLDKQFVATGDVRWVAKHFPLRTHSHAAVAAAASECAGDQGKFWPMHDMLFERAEQWSSANDPDSALMRLASDLKLNQGEFNACLTSRKALERVLRDIYDGQAIGVSNLPVFILIYGGVGHVLTGARSTEEFAATLRQQLKEANTQEKGDRTAANR